MIKKELDDMAEIQEFINPKSMITPGAAAALEIELALLTPLNDAATGMTTLSVTTAVLLDAVRAVNGHVINNTSGTANAKIKLDAWINVSMIGQWPLGCPNGWKQLGTDAGYDTTDWNVDPNFEDADNPSYEHVH